MQNLYPLPQLRKENIENIIRPAHCPNYFFEVHVSHITAQTSLAVSARRTPLLPFPNGHACVCVRAYVGGGGT